MSHSWYLARQDPNPGSEAPEPAECPALRRTHGARRGCGNELVAGLAPWSSLPPSPQAWVLGCEGIWPPDGDRTGHVSPAKREVEDEQRRE